MATAVGGTAGIHLCLQDRGADPQDRLLQNIRGHHGDPTEVGDAHRAAAQKSVRGTLPTCAQLAATPLVE